MLWSVIRVIFKTSSVTPEFFYVFNLVLSFSTCSQSFNKICVWEVLGANVLKQILALSGLSDAMALFSVFSIFARFPIIQPKRFILCILTYTVIFYLMRVVLSRFYIFWVRLSPDRCFSNRQVLIKRDCPT